MVDIAEERVSVAEAREDFDAIIARARETKRPITVTQDGSAVAVIIDARQYLREQESLAYLRAILEGLLSEGTFSHEEVEARLDALLAE